MSLLWPSLPADSLANPAGHILLVGLLDNLGKGAGGSAVQNLNLMLGLDESAGLRLSA